MKRRPGSDSRPLPHGLRWAARRPFRYGVALRFADLRLSGHIPCQFRHLETLPIRTPYGRSWRAVASFLPRPEIRPSDGLKAQPVPVQARADAFPVAADKLLRA